MQCEALQPLKMQYQHFFVSVMEYGCKLSGWFFPFDSFHHCDKIHQYIVHMNSIVLLVLHHSDNCRVLHFNNLVTWHVTRQVGVAYGSCMVPDCVRTIKLSEHPPVNALPKEEYCNSNFTFPGHVDGANSGLRTRLWEISKMSEQQKMEWREQRSALGRVSVKGEQKETGGWQWEWMNVIFNRIVRLAIGQSTWEPCVGHLTKYCVHKTGIT